MPKSIEDADFTFNDLVDWASGHVLQELLAGRLRQSLHIVCSQAIMWRLSHTDEQVGLNFVRRRQDSKVDPSFDGYRVSPSVAAWMREYVQTYPDPERLYTGGVLRQWAAQVRQGMLRIIGDESHPENREAAKHG